MPLVKGGRTVYGFALGMMMLDTTFPRLRGDIGNATTWDFPVVYRVVQCATPERLARAETDPPLLDPFVETVRAGGRRRPAVIISCGFLAIYQRELVAAVSIPVFSSPLLRVPMAARAMEPGQRVGIVAARPMLTEQHFAGVGWSSEEIPIVQVAPADDSHFTATFVGNAPEADPAVLDQEIGDLAERLVRDHPDLGAVVLECANLTPFAQTVRRVTGLPVFDLYTLGMQAYLATSGTDFGAKTAALA